MMQSDLFSSFSRIGDITCLFLPSFLYMTEHSLREFLQSEIKFTLICSLCETGMRHNDEIFSQLTFTCSNSTVKTLEQ